MSTPDTRVPTPEDLQNILAGGQVAGGQDEDEEEDEEEESQEVEPGVIEKTVVTENKHGFHNHTITKGKKKGKPALMVKIRIPVPPTLSGYAGEGYYGSEQAAKKAFDEYWARNKANSVRPVLRDAENELNWQQVGQTTADNYQPGRRGGYVPTFGKDELMQQPNIDAVIALLRERGVQVN